LADFDNAFALAAAMRGDVDIKIVDGGGHMCTQVLFAWLADYVFDWFAQRLLCQSVRARPGIEAALGERGNALPEFSSLALARVE
jgi:hypothetical protein